MRNRLLFCLFVLALGAGVGVAAGSSGGSFTGTCGSPPCVFTLTVNTPTQRTVTVTSPPVTTTVTSIVTTTVTAPSTTTTDTSPPPPPPGSCANSTPNAPGGPDPWGTCFPGPANTGVPSPIVLTAYTGPSTVTTPDTVIDSKTLGCINVAASGVVIKNSRITCSGTGYVVFSRDGAYTGTPLLIQDSEVSCNNTNGTALGEALFTAVRVNLHGCENGGDINQSVNITDSYIHDLFNGNGAHLDGLQFADHITNGQIITGALNVTYEHNTIFGMGADGSFGTSAIIQDHGNDTNITIDKNLLAGGAYTLYCPRGESYINGHVTNNVFSRLFSPTVGFYGASTDCGDETQSGNIYNDGTPYALEP